MTFLLGAGLAFSSPTDQSWGPARRLTFTDGDSASPAIAADSRNRLYVFWSDKSAGNWEIHMSKSPDGGSTWTPSQRLTWTSGASQSPAAAADPTGRLHLVWCEEAAGGGKTEIRYRQSKDGGTTWTSAQKLNWTPGVSLNPVIVADSSGNLKVIWRDDMPGKAEFYQRRSPDGGATWTSAERCTWNPGPVPGMDRDSNKFIHLVWYENSGGNWEIYYRRSLDGGVTWTDNQRLSWTAGKSTRPALALDSSNCIHVVWEDDTPGNGEIYYKKGIQK
jgi:hypothetical protein